jgi:hypothetical protein
MLAMGWNNVETAARIILQRLGGRGNGMTACTAMLGNVPLINALRATASLEDRLVAEIDRFAECMDRLREYRNYYVHGIHATLVGDGEAYAMLQGVETNKGKYRIIEERVTRKHLIYAIRHLMKLQAYGTALADHANDDFGTLARGGKPLPALPNMPEVPERLQRRRMTLDEYQPLF